MDKNIKKNHVVQINRGYIENEDLINKTITISGVKYELDEQLSKVFLNINEVFFTLDENNKVNHIESILKKHENESLLYYHSVFNFLLSRFIQNIGITFNIMLVLFAWIFIFNLYDNDKTLSIVGFFTALIQITGLFFNSFEDGVFSVTLGLGFYYVILLFILTVLRSCMFFFKKKKYMFIPHGNFKESLAKNIKI